VPGPSSLARRVSPFLGAAVLGLLLGVLPDGDVGRLELGLSIGLTLAGFAAAVVAPWRRLPSWVQSLPSFVYLLAVALLRDAVGGASSGVGPLLLLPVFWVALYGTRRQLAAVLAAVAATFYVPMLAIGGTEYPTTGWRSGALFVVVAAIIGYTVQDLIARLRSVLAERTELMARLEQLAGSDPLTGLANRRAWDEALLGAIRDAARHERRLCVAVLDLDHFKRVNDEHGHAFGDRVLRESAAAWQRELRPADLVARLGGEEFGVLLTDCALAPALSVTERVRAATSNGQSCSAGIAEWNGRESPADLLARADRLLYEAKQQGRNRSVVESADANAPELGPGAFRVDRAHAR
jgi:diguanylate cyclase (GGDEF)-like protein